MIKVKILSDNEYQELAISLGDKVVYGTLVSDESKYEVECIINSKPDSLFPEWTLNITNAQDYIIHT